MTAVTIRTARAQWSALVDRAHDGEEIIILKRGLPYARLIPLTDGVDAAKPVTGA